MFSLSNFPSTLDLTASRLSNILSFSVIHTLEPTILLLLTGVITLAIILGILLIPKDYVCSRTAEYAQPYNELWKTLVKFGAYPQWRSNITRVEINPPGHIPPDGFEWFREITTHSNIKFRIVERCEDRLLKREIVREKGVHFSGSWTIELEEISENSARVTITEKTRIHSVLHKAMALILGYNKTIDLFLTDLGTKFNQQVIITDATNKKEAENFSKRVHAE
ncbi:hypothetical protein RclHR1_01160025 [Rhizophagus clarus]|uniref:SRPBCC family protein n=1 Tax=Rhizophagus clarus TaxID=94130 RepID=A0A2Z6QJW6_9GLOM|nr:hypothetical protein RclHR1_01160025 [Rhizophagus clarus]GET01385.1 SRPBCC family protein [Rhizophagus clarus]